MGNFTISEILTILVIILIVFGPHRLPELARKAGSLLARTRQALDALRDELTTEYDEVVAPVREVRDELKSVRRDLGETVSSIGRDVKAAADLSDLDDAGAEGGAGSKDDPEEVSAEDGNSATTDEPATGTEGT